MKRNAGNNHKEFDSKKEALAFLKKNALMSVGWKEGSKNKVAIYWNGKLHVENAETKKIWGSMESGMDKQKIADTLTREFVSVDMSRVIERIEKLTDMNNHSEAVVRLAEVMNDGRILRAAEAVRTLRDYLGHMPRELSDIQSTLRERLLKKARGKLSPEEYNKLDMAF